MRNLVRNGDIQGLSDNFQNAGAAGLKELSTTTYDPCVKQALLKASLVASFVAFLLQSIQDPIQAAGIVCNCLEFNAQLINSCSA